MKRMVMGLVAVLGLTLVSANGLARQPDSNRLPLNLTDEPSRLLGDAGTPSLDELQPGDRLDLELYQRGQVSRFGIRREIVRIGNREFIIDDQDRLIIHISVY